METCRAVRMHLMAVSYLLNAASLRAGSTLQPRPAMVEERVVVVVVEEWEEE